MGKGLSPLVTLVILIAMVVAMGGSAYWFLSDQQDIVQEGAQKARLETVNMSCSRQTVTWRIRNSAKYGVGDLRGEIFFVEDGVQNGTLFMQNQAIPSELGEGKTATAWTFTTPRPLKLGQTYNIELSISDNSVTGTCTAGDPWWNVNWDYRRRIKLQSSAISPGNDAATQLPTEELVADGKLQPRCQDLRIVVNRNDESYNLSTPAASCATTDLVNVTFTVDNPSIAEYTTYVYYGNPSADNQSISIENGAPMFPLGKEERIGLPN